MKIWNSITYHWNRWVEYAKNWWFIFIFIISYRGQCIRPGCAWRLSWDPKRSRSRRLCGRGSTWCAPERFSEKLWAWKESFCRPGNVQNGQIRHFQAGRSSRCDHRLNILRFFRFYIVTLRSSKVGTFKGWIAWFGALKGNKANIMWPHTWFDSSGTSGPPTGVAVEMTSSLFGCPSLNPLEKEGLLT